MDDEIEEKAPHRGLKKGLYVIPTLFTAANVAMGYLAVLSSIRGFSLADTHPDLAASYFDRAGLAIGLAILFDTVDGRVARATRTATEIGVQFDSLADVLTFGIAPTALIYAWAFGPTFTENTFGHNLAVFILFMFLMCGAFRLARFNLQATRPVKLIEGATKVDKKSFVGLPIPPAGGLLAAIVHFAPLPLTAYGNAPSHYYSYALLGLIATLSILMVSTIRYTSMKTAGKGPQGIFLVLALAAAAMSVWFYSEYALLILAAIYVVHGPIWWVARLLGRVVKPSRTSH
ncbi:MAG: CDP-alcohol phosphatidyltransferase family protein [Chloracidobacterium sp.]|nr:CDP-alcohol phosphatidyltransferase family protein [Chloracidobacterium sp.]